MSILQFFGSSMYICPDCGSKLKPESEVWFGSVEEELWKEVYNLPTCIGLPGLVRRDRWVCMNKSCESYYLKTHHKFLLGLLGTIKDEHFLDDAMRNTRKSEDKRSRHTRHRGG